MNLYLIISGAIGVAGSLAHTFLGHGWTVDAIDPNHAASQKFSGVANQRFVMWFWHIGSAVLWSTSAAFLLEGLAVVHLAPSLLWYMSALWLAITAIGLVAAIRPPSQLRSMVPVLVGIPINALILLGLTVGR